MRSELESAQAALARLTQELRQQPAVASVELGLVTSELRATHEALLQARRDESDAREALRLACEEHGMSGPKAWAPRVKRVAGVSALLSSVVGLLFQGLLIPLALIVMLSMLLWFAPSPSERRRGGESGIADHSGAE